MLYQVYALMCFFVESTNLPSERKVNAAEFGANRWTMSVARDETRRYTPTSSLFCLNSFSSSFSSSSSSPAVLSPSALRILSEYAAAVKTSSILFLSFSSSKDFIVVVIVSKLCWCSKTKTNSAIQFALTRLLIPRHIPSLQSCVYLLYATTSS